MEVLGYGVDLSRHQDPAAIPWESWKGQIDFAFARASYGAGLADRSAIAHIKNARAIGVRVGLYHFFRDLHTVSNQIAAFQAIASACKLGPGDIVPAVDLESDDFAKRTAVPSWSENARQLVATFAATYGECIVYINPSDFERLGKPSWVLERPLWIAKYTASETVPTIGGKTPILWQNRVDDFDPDAAGGYDKEAKMPIDQSRRLAPLPLIPPAITEDDVKRVNGEIALTLDQQIREHIEQTEPRKLS